MSKKYLKPCVDCVYFNKLRDSEWSLFGYNGSECSAPQNKTASYYNIVTGEKNQSYRWTWCSHLRKNGLLSSLIWNSCGKRGRWFKPKEVEKS